MKSFFLLALVVLPLLGVELFSTLYERWRYPSDKTTAPIKKQAIASKKFVNNKNSVRIGFFGASTVVGTPIRELGFVSQLERLLSASHPHLSFEMGRFQKGGIPSGVVLQKLRSTRDQHWDAFVVVTAHNEFLRNFSGDRLNTMRMIYKNLHRFATGRVMSRLMGRFNLAKGPDYINGSPTRLFDRDSRRFAQRLSQYNRNLDEIVRYARKKGVPLFLGVPPSNFRDWAPVSRLHLSDKLPPSYESKLNEIKELLARNDLKKATVLIEKVPKIHRNDASFIYLKAKLFDKQNNYPVALRLYLKARELDPLPTRTFSAFNKKIRSFKGQPNVFIQDYERLLLNKSPHGLLGLNLILDNVHPTPRGNYLMGRLLYDHLNQHLPKLSKKRKRRVLSFEELMNRLQFKKKAYAIKLHLESGIYAMFNPFFNYSASRWHLNQALAMDPKLWDAWANLASVDLLEGKYTAGLKKLRKAVQLNSDTIDINDRKLTPYLRHALEKYRLDLDQLSQYWGSF